VGRDILKVFVTFVLPDLLVQLNPARPRSRGALAVIILRGHKIIKSININNMKNDYLAKIILLIYFLLLLVSCKKNNETESLASNLTDLHDTLISLPAGRGSIVDSLDIDKDSIYDVGIILVSAHGHNYSLDYEEIIPLNGFKIAYINYVIKPWSLCYSNSDTVFSIDTVMMPKIFNQGDTIKFNNYYTKYPLMIYYYNEEGSVINNNCFGLTTYKINSSNSFYVALNKQNGEDVKFIWIKIKCFSSIGVVLNSCNFVQSKDYCIIK
jgi:hypothetical protein